VTVFEAMRDSRVGQAVASDASHHAMADGAGVRVNKTGRSYSFPWNRIGQPEIRAIFDHTAFEWRPIDPKSPLEVLANLL